MHLLRNITWHNLRSLLLGILLVGAFSCNQPHNKVKIEVIQGGLFEDDLINKYTPIEHETTEVSEIPMGRVLLHSEK